MKTNPLSQGGSEAAATETSQVSTERPRLHHEVAEQLASSHGAVERGKTSEICG